MITKITRERQIELANQFYEGVKMEFSAEAQYIKHQGDREYCDSNWLCNLYLIYLNDYITIQRLVDEEVGPVIEGILPPSNDLEEEHRFLHELCYNLLMAVRTMRALLTSATLYEVTEIILENIDKYSR
jgi:hypothetical protein